jgi:maleamate amidohydrolase
MDDLYEVCGYGSRDVGFGDRPAVLVVDLQNAVTKPEAPMGRSPLVHAAVDRLVELLPLARLAGAPVVFCNTAFLPDRSDMPYWKIEAMDDWIVGSWGAEIDERLWRDGDVLVTKKGPSIFFGTNVPSVLTLHRVDTVILTGANTSGCIRASALDSFSYGYRTIVPRECVGDQGLVPHEQNLLDIDRRYVDVVAVDVVFDYLRARVPAEAAARGARRRCPRSTARPSTRRRSRSSSTRSTRSSRRCPSPSSTRPGPRSSRSAGTSPAPCTTPATSRTRSASSTGCLST